MMRAAGLGERLRALCARPAVPALRAPLHTSAPAAESKRRRAARLRRNANLAQRDVKHRLFEMSRPDPVLGHQLTPQGEALWQNSELAQLLLSKSEVWGVQEDRRGRLVPVDAQAHPDDTAVDAEVAAHGGPRRLNFGLDADARRTLFQSLPRVMVEDRILDSPNIHSLHSEGIEAVAAEQSELEAEQARSVETLSRILDLRNASGKGIQVENTRRIISHFGARDDDRGIDTGSPEVQAAVFTYRIRNLAEHLLGARHDNSNRRAMRKLVHKRARILRYLKSIDPLRYQNFLPRIGVEARAVEGEIVVPGKPKVKRI